MFFDQNLLKDFAYVVALVVMQIYNSNRHQQNVRRIETNRDLVDSGYAALHADFADAKAAIERMNITINGGDRRKSAPPLTPGDVEAAQAAGFGQRWTDPREPRPATP